MVGIIPVVAGDVVAKVGALFVAKLAVASRFRPSRRRLPSTLKLAPIASVPVPVSEREAVAGTATDPLARSDGTSPLKRNEKRPAAD